MIMITAKIGLKHKQTRDIVLSEMHFRKKYKFNTIFYFEMKSKFSKKITF